MIEKDVKEQRPLILSVEYRDTRISRVPSVECEDGGNSIPFHNGEVNGIPRLKCGVAEYDILRPFGILVFDRIDLIRNSDITSKAGATEGIEKTSSQL